MKGNARKKDKYKRMRQQEIQKEMKKKAGKGKVTPFTGECNTLFFSQNFTMVWVDSSHLSEL